MFALDAYLARLGLSAPPGLEASTLTLEEVHARHVRAIPFENLDPRRGVAVALAPAALHDKLVARRRGGYCFEHNLLLRAALDALGFETEPMLARVRWGAPPGMVRPRTHLVLRVGADGAMWHADVGFGPNTLLTPIPFGPGGPYEQAGWRSRVIEEGDELVLQCEAEGEWRDAYAFEPRPVPPIDITLSNWFTSTHPDSDFVKGLIVSAVAEDGTRLVLSDWSGELTFSRRTPASTTVTSAERSELPGLLAEHFGLPGWCLDGAGRLLPG